MVRQYLTCQPTLERFQNALCFMDEKFVFKGYLDSFYSPVLECRIFNPINQIAVDIKLMIDTGCFETIINKEIVDLLKLTKSKDISELGKGVNDISFKSALYNCGICIGNKDKFISKQIQIAESESSFNYHGVVGTLFLNIFQLEFIYNPKSKEFFLNEL